jgi:hypothetical protein
MARDKAQAAAAMRVRMGRLRVGTPAATTTQPSSGNGGRRGGGGQGRGVGGRTAKENKERQETTYKSKLLSPTNQTSDSNTAATPTSNPTMITQDNAATISKITEQTTTTTMDMEEDDDGLADNMKNGIPSAIEKFTPNIQWSRDIPKNVPKRRYGLEIKITLENTPTPTDQIPTYHHIRISRRYRRQFLLQLLAP